MRMISLRTCSNPSSFFCWTGVLEGGDETEFACFAFGAATVSLCTDQAQQFQMGKVVTEAATCQGVAVDAGTEIFIAVVDSAGEDTVIWVRDLMVEGFKQQVVMRGEILQHSVTVAFDCFTADSIKAVEADGGCCLLECLAEPDHGEASVGGVTAE